MNRNDRKTRRANKKALRALLLKAMPLKRLYIEIATPFVLALLILVCIVFPLAGRVAIAGTTIMGMYNAIPIIKELISRKKVHTNDDCNRS